MPVFRRLLGFAAMACALTACAPVARIEAASDVHAFLISIRDNDRDGFDAHVDRRAVESELESRILAQTGQPKSGDTVRALGAIFAKPLSKLAGDAFLRPDAFRAVAEYYGYRPDMQIPGDIAIAAVLRRLPDGSVCATLKHDGPCASSLSPTKNGTWKTRKLRRRSWGCWKPLS